MDRNSWPFNLVDWWTIVIRIYWRNIFLIISLIVALSGLFLKKRKAKSGFHSGALLWLRLRWGPPSYFTPETKAVLPPENHPHIPTPGPGIASSTRAQHLHHLWCSSTPYPPLRSLRGENYIAFIDP